MHLEPAQSDLNNLPATHLDPTDDPPAPIREERPRSREGLPAAFKMRHGRHYVEQLMGDAPLRTIREIPLAEIEPPADEPGNIDDLRRSVKDLGILQPLLVAQMGSAGGERNTKERAPEARVEPRFRIIAGGHRYRVAVQLELRTVPCLVYETTVHSVEALREAAARRAAPPVSPELPMPTLSDESRRTHPAAGLREVTSRLAFVSAVMPALDVAGHDPLRWNILTDLMKVEMERARSTAAAIEWLSSSTTAIPHREPLDAAAVIEATLEAVGPEARLQGVKLEVSSALDGYQITADRGMVMRGLTGLIQGMLAISPAGSTLHINCSGTAVRPALIVAVTQSDCDIPSASLDRFFDAEFAQHPNGMPGALVLAGVAHVARLHGGRVHTRADEDGGCTSTFVIPKPLGD